MYTLATSTGVACVLDNEQEDDKEEMSKREQSSILSRFHVQTGIEFVCDT
jgi:hypothetical protein